jgi:hypothetical protein
MKQRLEKDTFERIPTSEKNGRQKYNNGSEYGYESSITNNRNAYSESQRLTDKNVSKLGPITDGRKEDGTRQSTGLLTGGMRSPRKYSQSKVGSQRPSTEMHSRNGSMNDLNNARSVEVTERRALPKIKDIIKRGHIGAN